MGNIKDKIKDGLIVRMLKKRMIPELETKRDALNVLIDKLKDSHDIVDIVSALNDSPLKNHENLDEKGLKKIAKQYGIEDS